MGRWRAGWVLAAVAAALMVAAACGGDEPEPAADGGTAGRTEATATPAQNTTGRPAVTVSTHPELGRILTDADGRTLYVFTRDQESTSTCYDQCEQLWPPLYAQSGTPAAGQGVTGRLGVTTRRDGRQQVTYDGKPLYYYQADQAPGDARGQGVNNVWFVVQVGQAAGGPSGTGSIDY